MGANTTVYFRGDNLKNIKSESILSGKTKNEIINIAVEQYLKSLKQKQS